MLSLYRIPAVETRVARNENEAIALPAIGFPVVLKVYSETITHKTDVGGVKLNLHNEDAVRKRIVRSKLLWPKRQVATNSRA